MMVFTPMNPEIKRLWLIALRDPKNKQARGSLAKIRSDGKLGMCCLGVACGIHNALTSPNVNRWTQATNNSREFAYVSYVNYGDYASYSSHSGIPNIDVLNWMGITDLVAHFLAEKNDNGASFKQIANWIEKNL